jgi:hypothetical protein
MRTVVVITDPAGFTERVSLFGHTSAPNGIYVVATLLHGDLERKAMGIGSFHRFTEK